MTTLVKKSKQSESQLLRELSSLFGKQIVNQSECISLEDMALEAELVKEGARQLLQHKGHIKIQRHIVEAMDEDTALALCKWIREPHAVGDWIMQQQ